MATSYSSRYQIKLIGSGLEAGDWGDSTNENLKRIEETLGGSSVVVVNAYPTSGTTTPTWDGGDSTLNWINYDTANSDSGDYAAGTPTAAGRSSVVVFTNIASPTVSGDVIVKVRGNAVANLPDRVFIAVNKLLDNKKLTLNLDEGVSTSGNFEIPNGYSAMVYTSEAAKGSTIVAKTVNNALEKIKVHSIQGDASAGVISANSLVGEVLGGLVTGSGDRIEVSSSSASTIKLSGYYPTGSNNVALGKEALDAVVATKANTGTFSGIAKGSTTTITASNVLATGDIVSISGVSTSGGSDWATELNGKKFNVASATGSAFVITHNTSALTDPSSVSGGVGAEVNASSNVAVGGLSGEKLTNEFQNVLIGTEAGRYVASGGTPDVGDNNTLVGHQAGKGGSGTNKATDNTAIGSCSLEAVTTGTHNSFLGKKAGETLTEGTFNVGNGYQSGDDITTGTGNIFIGAQAGKGVQTGDYNVTLGFKSGDSDGANNLGSNKLVIHSDSNGTADPATEALVYGDFSTGLVSFNSETNSATTGVAIQNTTASGTGFNFLRCIADSDGSPATKFQVRGDGQVQVGGSEVHAGADYADMFEWADGNPEGVDRIGLSVVIAGDKGFIRPATIEDTPGNIIGIVSGTASVVGNAAWSHWHGKYIRDDFGRVSEDESFEYDNSKTYVPREKRHEWAVIGLAGRVHIRKGSPTHPSWSKLRSVSSVTEEWLVR